MCCLHSTAVAEPFLHSVQSSAMALFAYQGVGFVPVLLAGQPGGYCGLKLSQTWPAVGLS